MKTTFTYLTLLLLASRFTAAKDNRVLIPPFENLSQRRAPTQYEISAGGISERVPTRNVVDRYSQVPREILEDIVSEIDGVVPVERQRLDQFFLETGLNEAQPLVDRDKAKATMIKLNAPIAIQGTILGVDERLHDYNGYVKVRGHRWHAKIRIRIYTLVGGNLEIPYSKLINGEYFVMDTPYTTTTEAEGEIALGLLTTVLEKLRTDTAFKVAVKGARSGEGADDAEGGLITVPFDIIPEGADVYVDSIWRGQTPCRISMEAGKEVGIRLEKPEFIPWQAKIVPQPGFRVNRDLEKVPNEKGEK
jgi:hypothetical protein